jgi:hypothetical protein
MIGKQVRQCFRTCLGKSERTDQDYMICLRRYGERSAAAGELQVIGGQQMPVDFGAPCFRREPEVDIAVDDVRRKMIEIDQRTFDVVDAEGTTFGDGLGVIKGGQRAEFID